jgi:hypothetical protein
MMDELGKDLDIDITHRAFTNKYILKDGGYEIERLQVLAFLYCEHEESKLGVEEEFW